MGEGWKGGEKGNEMGEGEMGTFFAVRGVT